MGNNHQTGCDCAACNPPLGDLPLAMAYVRRQRWDEVYRPDTALCVGTIFPELELPFMGKGGRSR